MGGGFDLTRCVDGEVGVATGEDVGARHSGTTYSGSVFSDRGLEGDLESSLKEEVEGDRKEVFFSENGLEGDRSGSVFSENGLDGDRTGSFLSENGLVH